MSDPRERIETKNLGVELMMTEDDTVDKTAYWWLGANDIHEGVAQWPEVVEFARAILAADLAWRESQAPTLAELNGKYPAAMPACVQQERSVDGFYAEYLTSGVPPGYECARFASRVEALRWLAAKLEELDSMPPPDEAALDAQRE